MGIPGNLTLGSGKLLSGRKTVTLGAEDDDYILTGFAGPNATTITKLKSDFTGVGGTTGVLDGDNGRRAILTVTHATSIVAVDGVITGIDEHGVALTEAWSVTATGTSKTYTGLKCFKRVDQITFIASGNASTDTIKVGIQYSRRLADSVSCQGVYVQALTGNTGAVEVGDSQADVTAPQQGYRLIIPTATNVPWVWLPIYNLRLVTVDPAVTAEGVSYLAVL